MSVVNALAGVAVRNLREAMSWYERLLDRSASQPMSEVAEFKFERGGWLQVFQDVKRAGASSVTLTVTDLQSHLDDLERKGIDAGHITETKSVKTATVQDPDGNQIVFAQPLTDRLAH